MKQENTPVKATIKPYNITVKADTKQKPNVPTRILAALVVYGD